MLERAQIFKRKNNLEDPHGKKAVKAVSNSNPLKVADVIGIELGVENSSSEAIAD
jgi:hypothetical protein